MVNHRDYIDSSEGNFEDEINTMCHMTRVGDEFVVSALGKIPAGAEIFTNYGASNCELLKGYGFLSEDHSADGITIDLPINSFLKSIESSSSNNNKEEPEEENENEESLFEESSFYLTRDVINNEFEEMVDELFQKIGLAEASPLASDNNDNISSKSSNKGFHIKMKQASSLVKALLSGIKRRRKQYPTSLEEDIALEEDLRRKIKNSTNNSSSNNNNTDSSNGDEADKIAATLLAVRFRRSEKELLALIEEKLRGLIEHIQELK
jgi:protein required for attachment to host cells